MKDIPHIDKQFALAIMIVTTQSIRRRAAEN